MSTKEIFFGNIAYAIAKYAKDEDVDLFDERIFRAIRKTMTVLHNNGLLSIPLELEENNGK